jgi:catechol 2,3-dioxygenase-like lactoylglutathione lyase family enzyme
MEHTAMQLYASVGSNQLDRALDYYEQLLGSIGWKRLFDNPAGGCFFGDAAGSLIAVVKPFDERAASVGNGTMIGLGLANNAEVAAFHAKALALGGTNEGDPGFRSPEEVGAYFAYFRDLDGNKLCAYYWPRGG